MKNFSKKFFYALLFIFIFSINSYSQTPISYGETITGSISVVGEVDTYTFSGTAGDKVIIRMTESTTGSSEYMEPRIELYNPSGQLIEDSVNSSQTCLFLVLPSTGTYTIFASDGYPGEDDGNYAIFIQRSFDPGLADTLSYGETVTSNLSAQGDIDTYVFSGTAGDKVIIRMTESTSGSSEYMEPQVELYNPAGELFADSVNSSQTHLFLELPETGTFTLLASDSYPGEDYGNYALFIQRSFDPGLADTLSYGETVTSNLSAQGDIDTYVFSGTAGDKVIIRMTESTSGSSEYMEPQVELYNPAGELFTDSVNSSQTHLFLELPETGTYTLLASDSYPGEDYGNYALFIQRSFDPGLADTLSYGETVTSNLSAQGDIDTYVFSGTAGDKVIIRMTESTSGSSEYMEPQVELYNPAGELFTDSLNSSQTHLFLELPETGTYTLLASDSYPGEDYGKYALFIQRSFDPELADTLSFGETVAADLSTQGDIDTYTFLGTVYDKITIRMTESTAGSSEYMEPRIELYNPEGVLIADSSDVSQSSITYTLKNTGYYTILAGDSYPGEDYGNYSIYIFGFPGSGPEAEILTYSLGIPPQTGEAVIDAVKHTVYIEVEYETELTDLVASFTLSEGATATVDGDDQETGVTPNDFSKPVTYTIASEDGEIVQDWIITVVKEPNDETDIISFSFGIPPQTGDAVIDPAAHTIIIELENGNDVTELIAMFTLSDGATATIEGIDQTSAVTANDFSNNVAYLITAEDGVTTQEWTVSIVVLNNLNKINSGDIKTYPNPVSDVLHIDPGSTGLQVEFVSIYTISGQKLFELKNAVSEKLTLSLSHLSEGLYILEIQGADTYIRKLFIKNNP